MIDTHCHLTFPDFSDRVGQTLEEARAAGVSGCITISTTTLDCLDALAIARAHDRVWCTAGVHPLYADAAHPRSGSEGVHVWDNLRRVASDPKCVAWGELGLDNHYPEPAQAIQRRALDEQLAFIQSVNHDGPGGIGPKRWQTAGGGMPAGVQRGLPVVLHCREAFNELIPVLEATTLDPTRFVFHCFTGSTSDVRKALDFGGMISFTGVVTYPNAHDQRKAAQLVPPDRIMVETDAPFLPPVPHRGKRPCVPAYVVHTARALAELRGVAFDAFDEQLNANTQAFFGVS